MSAGTLIFADRHESELRRLVDISVLPRGAIQGDLAALCSGHQLWRRRDADCPRIEFRCIRRPPRNTGAWRRPIALHFDGLFWHN